MFWHAGIRGAGAEPADAAESRRRSPISLTSEEKRTGPHMREDRLPAPRPQAAGHAERRRAGEEI